MSLDTDLWQWQRCAWCHCFVPSSHWQAHNPCVTVATLQQATCNCEHEFITGGGGGGANVMVILKKVSLWCEVVKPASRCVRGHHFLVTCHMLCVWSPSSVKNKIFLVLTPIVRNQSFKVSEWSDEALSCLAFSCWIYSRVVTWSNNCFTSKVAIFGVPRTQFCLNFPWLHTSSTEILSPQNLKASSPVHPNLEVHQIHSPMTECLVLSSQLAHLHTDAHSFKAVSSGDPVVDPELFHARQRAVPRKAAPFAVRLWHLGNVQSHAVLSSQSRWLSWLSLTEPILKPKLHVYMADLAACASSVSTGSNTLAHFDTDGCSTQQKWSV